LDAGESDLGKLLEALEPVLHPQRYAFVAASDGNLPPDAFALIREAEGLALIRPDPNGHWARISLGVHSSLEAVGLTAELSRRLTEASINANIIAGLNHDHLFVPWDRRAEAVDVLRPTRS
jgi:hypothetical protein